MGDELTPEQRLALTEALAALPGSRSGALFQAHGLGAAYAGAGKYAGKRAKIVAALNAAEATGRLEQVLQAAQQLVSDAQPGVVDESAEADAHSARAEEGVPVANRVRSIFISHAFDDRPFADLLIDTMVLGGVPRTCFFYSSARSTGIPTGVDLLDDLRKALNEAELVVELLSETYMERPLCVAEWGAAWAMKKMTFPIVIPPLTRATVKAELGNFVMHRIGPGPVDDEDVTEMLNDLHKACGTVLGNAPEIGDWRRAEKHFKAALPDVLVRVASARAARPTSVTASVTAVAASSPPPTSAPANASRAPAAPTSAAIGSSDASQEDQGLQEATDKLRAALSKLHRVARVVVLHNAFWNEAYRGDEWDDFRSAERDREIEFSDMHDGWVPRDGHRKVSAAMTATRDWGTAVAECTPEAAEALQDVYDLNELDPQSHDVWRRLDLI